MDRRDDPITPLLNQWTYQAHFAYFILFVPAAEALSLQGARKTKHDDVVIHMFDVKLAGRENRRSRETRWLEDIVALLFTVSCVLACGVCRLYAKDPYM